MLPIWSLLGLIIRRILDEMSMNVYSISYVVEYKNFLNTSLRIKLKLSKNRSPGIYTTYQRTKYIMKYVSTSIQLTRTNNIYIYAT